MAQVRREKLHQERKSNGDVKYNWWAQPRESLHSDMIGSMRRIQENQSHRDVMDVRHACLYNNKEILGLMAHQFNKTVPYENNISLNVTKSCIDTVSANLAMNKTRPFFLTEDGNWDLGRRAKKLTSFMDGWFDEQKIYHRVGNITLPMMGTFGTRAAKLYIQDDWVEVEPTPTFGLVVDEIEGMYRKPTQMFEFRYVFREALIEQHPKYENQIRAVGATDGCESADMILVVEGWKLGSNGVMGKHAIAIETATLACDDWKHSFFPFVFSRWNTPFLGFYGTGIAEELIPLQIAINRTLRDIEDGQHLFCVPQVWLEYFADLPKNQMTNQFGATRYYKGQPPLFMTPQAFAPEVYTHLWNLYQRAFELIGVSQLSATGQKPAGIQANAALRTLQDIESKRFMIAEENNQEFYMEIAEMAIEFFAEIDAKKKGGLSVRARAGSGIEAIKWDDVRMEKNKYLMRSYPTNFLSNTPAGKKQDVQELLDMGLFSREEILTMIDYPDTKPVTNLYTAPREIVAKMIERMLDGGPYTPPEPYMDMKLTQQFAQMSLLNAQVNGAPEKILENLRRFVDDAADKVRSAAEANIPKMGDPALPQAMPTEAIAQMAGAQGMVA